MSHRRTRKCISIQGSPLWITFSNINSVKQIVADAAILIKTFHIEGVRQQAKRELRVGYLILQRALELIDRRLFVGGVIVVQNEISREIPSRSVLQDKGTERTMMAAQAGGGSG